MKKHLMTSGLMAVATTVLLGIIYPLVITGLAQLFFKDKANGQLIVRNGNVVGSRIIGQAFVGPGYFHSRPSAAGNGYDAANSNGSQLGPTNQHLIDRVRVDVANNEADSPGRPVPVDLITASASGLDPDISPAAAEFQVRRIAGQRAILEDQVRRLIQQHTQPRQLGILGEPRVNLLELNLDLDASFPKK
jgi:potassium-transporting ATPase KdpC subunit